MKYLLLNKNAKRGKKYNSRFIKLMMGVSSIAVFNSIFMVSAKADTVTDSRIPEYFFNTGTNRTVPDLKNVPSQGMVNDHPELSFIKDSGYGASSQYYVLGSATADITSNNPNIDSYLSAGGTLNIKNTAIGSHNGTSIVNIDGIVKINNAQTGAIYSGEGEEDNKTTLTIDNSHIGLATSNFINNDAVSRGGSIDNEGGTISIKNSTLDGTIENLELETDYGSQNDVHVGKVTLDNVKVNGGEAQYFSHASDTSNQNINPENAEASILNETTMVIQNGSVIANGIVNTKDEDGLNIGGNLTIDNSHVNGTITSGEKSHYKGFSLYNGSSPDYVRKDHGVKPGLTTAIIQNGSTVEHGIYNDQNGQLTIDNSKIGISDKSMSGKHSGISVLNKEGTVNITNNAVLEGAIYNKAGNMTIENSHIGAHNAKHLNVPSDISPGESLENEGGVVSIKNSTFDGSIESWEESGKDYGNGQHGDDIHVGQITLDHVQVNGLDTTSIDQKVSDDPENSNPSIINQITMTIKNGSVIAHGIVNDGDDEGPQNDVGGNLTIDNSQVNGIISGGTNSPYKTFSLYNGNISDVQGENLGPAIAVIQNGSTVEHGVYNDQNGQLTIDNSTIGANDNGVSLLNNGGTALIQNGSILKGAVDNEKGTITIDSATIGEDSKGISFYNNGGTININISNQFHMAGGISGNDVKDVYFNLQKGGVFNFDKASSTFDQNLSGEGAVSVNSGYETLTGHNTYTGPTTIGNGVDDATLNLSETGSITSGVHVENKATLAGSGQVLSTVTVDNGGSITSGILQNNSLQNGLTVNNIIFGNDNKSLTNLTESLNGSSFNTSLKVNDKLTINGMLFIHSLGAMQDGSYALITYKNAGNNINTDQFSLNSAALSASQIYNFNTSQPGTINLTIAQSNNNTNWEGNTGTWSKGSGSNWSGGRSSNDKTWDNSGNVAKFNGRGGTVTIDNSHGGVQSGGLNFANNSNYTLTGAPLTTRGEQFAVTVGQNATAIVSSNITDTQYDQASLVKDGAGALTLGGSSSTVNDQFTKGIHIKEGALTIDNANVTTKDVHVENGTLALSNATITGYLNTGDKNSQVVTINKESSVASLKGQGGVNLAQGSTLSLNNTLTSSDQTSTYSGVISGQGGVTLKDGVQTLTAANTYKGLTRIGGDATDPTLILSGSGGLNSDVLVDKNGVFIDDNSTGSVKDDTIIVQNDGILGGAGNLGGNVTVKDGSIIDAGRGVTTGDNLTLQSLVMEKGSILNVTPSSSRDVVSSDKNQSLENFETINKISNIIQSNQVTVTDNPVSLEGVNIVVNGQQGLVKVGDAYKVLVADKGFSTKQIDSSKNSTDLRDQVTVNNQTKKILLTPEAVFYNDDATKASDLYIIEEKTANYGSIAQTHNEQTMANYLDHAVDQGLTNDITQSLDNISTAAQGKQILKSLSGELHSSARTAMIEDSYFIRKGILDRLDVSDCSTSGRDRTMGTYDVNTGEKNGSCSNDDIVMWGEAYGSMGHNGGDGNASGMHHMTTGFMIGADAPIGTWRAGGMAAYGRSNFSAGGVQSSGHSNNATVAAYAGNHWGNLNLKLYLEYAQYASHSQLW